MPLSRRGFIVAASARRSLRTLRMSTSITTRIWRSTFRPSPCSFRFSKRDASGVSEGEGATLRTVTDPVINIDDAWGQRLYGELPFGFSYGLDSEAQMRPVEYRLETGGITAIVETEHGAIELRSELIGEYNLYNILAALSVTHLLGVEIPAIESGITALKKVPGRLEPVAVPESRFRAFVDYAHTGDALERVLTELERVGSGRIITVFGCGGNRDHEKRPEMGESRGPF